MIAIGPWRYTEQDARRTVDHGVRLVDLLAEAVPAEHDLRTALQDLRSRIDATDRAVASGETDLGDALRTVVAARDEAADLVRASGILGPDLDGTVAHLALGDGGVPKPPTPRVEVGWGGVVGDRQAARAHHGRPWQALCLWSTEVIDDFVAGGHHLAPGFAGENVTVTGLPWDRVRPGTRLRLGTVLCEVWSYTTPCTKNARWFSDGRFDRMHHREGPVSRVYALVLEPGAIAVDDRAVLLTGA